MDVAPVIKRDRTFVPLRFVAEHMGLKVDWDATSYTVILQTQNQSPYFSEINGLLKELNSKNEELKNISLPEKKNILELKLKVNLKS